MFFNAKLFFGLKDTSKHDIINLYIQKITIIIGYSSTKSEKDDVQMFIKDEEQ